MEESNTYSSRVFSESIAKPSTVDVDKAKASFKKGMLWVVLPKKAKAISGTHSIKVEHL